jgi:hypothetical protein
MKQFVSIDLSFSNTMDQVPDHPDHITVSFADEAEERKNFRISATHGCAKRGK